MKTSTVCFLLCAIVYFVLSNVLFIKIYKTSKVIIDEEFHLPLGMAYCKYDFSVWDSKVTTLPGLYLVSTLTMGVLGKCTTYWLRFVSLAASVVNLFLFYYLFSKFEKNTCINIFSAFTLALLPPLYFFSHLYYTDLVSLMMILMMFFLNEAGYTYFSSIFGMLSVLCRQTNIIWVGLVLGKYVVVELYCNTINRKFSHGSPRGFELRNMAKFERILQRQPVKLLLNMPLMFWLDVLAYSSVIITFVYFTYLNGSIVVGDKTAHQVTLHIPQLFYFSLFCLIFAWPHFFSELRNFIKFTKRHRLFFLALINIGCLIVHYNTQIHPYMLADNRHYIFYIWNRFYGKYDFFRYLMVPVYIFAWYAIIKLMHNENDISWLLMYVPAVIGLLVTQKLIDVRYYLVPYVIFRLRFQHSHNTALCLILEFITHIIINYITFYVFFHKTIFWSDYHLPQRLIW